MKQDVIRRVPSKRINLNILLDKRHNPTEPEGASKTGGESHRQGLRDDDYRLSTIGRERGDLGDVTKDYQQSSLHQIEPLSHPQIDCQHIISLIDRILTQCHMAHQAMTESQVEQPPFKTK